MIGQGWSSGTSPQRFGCRGGLNGSLPMRIPRFQTAFLVLASLLGMAAAHDSKQTQSSGAGSPKKQDRPRYKSEAVALEELSFLVRDLDKRMRLGDVEGVHEGAWEIAATADNLWVLGEKKKDRAPNRMTINGYMNLLKSAARELGTYEGMDDLEAGRTQLARVKEIFALLHNQYHPDHENHSVDRSPSDSGGVRSVPKIGNKSSPDSGGQVSPR